MWRMNLALAGAARPRRAGSALGGDSSGSEDESDTGMEMLGVCPACMGTLN